jgi:hypothetical protein
MSNAPTADPHTASTKLAPTHPLPVAILASSAHPPPARRIPLGKGVRCDGVAQDGMSGCPFTTGLAQFCNCQWYCAECAEHVGDDCAECAIYSDGCGYHMETGRVVLHR